MSRGDVEWTELDVRVDAEDRAGVLPGLIVGQDVTAYREVMQRVAAECEQRTGLVVDANLIAIEVLTEAVDKADGAWDPHVHIGSAAIGIVRALRDNGWSRQ